MNASGGCVLWVIGCSFDHTGKGMLQTKLSILQSGGKVKDSG